MALTNEDLIPILRREEQVGQNWQDAELQGVRQQAFDYYDRNKVGDFTYEEGQSGVVTSEVADTIETVMPGMMRVFASGEQIAEFTPMEEEDEQAAKEATQYVPHVLMRENNGFRILYWFCKDVLLYRLATLTVDTEEVERTRKEPIASWTEEQMAFREEQEAENGATEIIWEVEEDEQPQLTAQPSLEDGPTDLGGFAPVKTFSGTITVTRKRKRVVPDNVAPEDLLVSPANVRDIDQASYVGYRKEVTASDLRILGLSQEDIDGLSANRYESPEENQRQDGQSDNMTRKDDQRRLWLVLAYVRVDVDGDGISEMVRVLYAHAGGENGAIIERMEWEEDEAPITIGSAILMSHSIVGRSLFDQTQDLQEVGTAVTRAMLDNTYQVVRPRPLINNKVPILSVLDHTAGMPVQVDTTGNPAEHISYLQTTSIIEPALAVMGYLENKRDQRTGTSRLGNNMDSDALSDASKMTKGGTQILRSASQERQGLMVQTLANTALNRFFRHIYRAIKRCATGPIKYYTPKGEWQSCDPTKWPEDMHLVVSVGAGTGDKMMEMQNLTAIGMAQEKVWQAQGGPGPAVNLEHIANTGRKLAEASGYRATNQFFASDQEVKKATEWKKQQDAINPPKTPEQLKVEGQLAAQKAKQDGEIALAREKAAAELELEDKKAAAKLAILKREGDYKLWLKEQELALDARLKEKELNQEAILGAMEIKANAEVQGAAQQREQSVSD